MANKLSVTIRAPTPIRANVEEPDKVTASFPNATPTGGTSDYNKLKNLPTLNGVEVSGDHDSSYYGITHMWFGTRDQYNALPVIDPTVCYCIKEGS